MKLPKNPFLKFGEFLVKKTRLDQPGHGNRKLCQEINLLSAGKKDAVGHYYAEKIADTLLILTVMSAVSLLVFLTSDRGSRIVEDQRITRPGYGAGDREEELEVFAEGESEIEQITVTVQGQKYTDQQVEELLNKARQNLEVNLTGENVSLDEVRQSLTFPASLENGAVKVSWMTMPYGIIHDDGTITGGLEETGTVVEIQATLSCQGKELVYETAACVYPPLLTEQEKWWQAVRDAAQQADQETVNEESMNLPRIVNGRNLIWLLPSSDLTSLFLFLTIFIPFCVFLQKDQKIHQKAKERKLQLAMDYPELMWKMTMLLGAGLTIRGAFSRIAAEYKKENNGEIHYAYEEMLCTCYEMKSGVAEGTAYENFGRRCQLPNYIKMGSLLSQNLKKGSKGLVSLLEKEALSSMEERKNTARKLGEQAGTKLLFPMLLLFGVVLIILIVPAFLSF